MTRLLRALHLIDRSAPDESGDEGMSTAEYCVGLAAAVAFAMVLYHVVSGGFVEGLVTKAIKTALSLVGI